MAMSEMLNGTVTTNEPSDMAFYKRAILRSAPPLFSVEILPPTKHGNAHSYGLRILPFHAAEETTFSIDDQSARSIHRCYEVWRRWEDCLDFQEKLETEWDRMSREKRRLLEAAKRGKKSGNGVYISSGNAASFESLPEGPDPKSVKFDVHVHLPKLSRKSSFFRVSESTVLTRGREFAALITALFDPDMPVLISELRQTSVIHDFFGWWRRDKERIQKLRKLNAAAGNVRASLSPTFSGGPPSPNSPQSALRVSVKGSHPPRSPGASSVSTFRPNSAMGTTNEFERPLPSPPQSPEYQRPRGKGPLQWPVGATPPPISRSSSTASRTTQESQLTIRLERPTPPTPPPSARQVRAGVNLRLSPAANRAGRVFDAREVHHFRADTNSPPASPTSSAHSSSSTSSSPPTTPTRPSHEVRLPVKSQLERPQSQISLDTIDYEMDFSFLGTDAVQNERSRRRESTISIASVDSMRTTCSADAIVPRRRRVTHSVRVSQPGALAARNWNGPYSVPDDVDELESVYEEAEEDEEVFDDACSYLDEIESFPAPPLVMESFLNSRRLSLPESVVSDDSLCRDPESPMSTLTFDSASSGQETCAVKVKYGDCVVAFRVPLDIPLPMLRTRLAQKFEQARGIHLNDDFVIGFLPSHESDADTVPIILSPCTAARFKDRPLTTASISSVAGMTRLLPVRSEHDWQSALYACAGKLTLHLLDLGA